MKSSKRFMFTVVAVAITLLTSCKKENMEEQIIGTWQWAGFATSEVESMPTNSKDIDWNWIYNLPEHKFHDRFLIITEETIQDSDNTLIPRQTYTYSIDSDGKLTILDGGDFHGSYLGAINYLKVKDKYLLLANILPYLNDNGKYYLDGIKYERVSE